MAGFRKTFSVNTETRLKNDVYRFAQKQHLAASLFSLDEIAIVPKILTPIIQASKTIEQAPTDSVSLSVPYIPDWPELASIYRASTMTLIEALQGGANIILAGHPGSGKTVALAWLASQLSQNRSGVGILEGLLPLYVHAQVMQHFLPVKEEDFPEGLEANAGTKPHDDRHMNQEYSPTDAVDILIKSIKSYTSTLTISRLPGLIRGALEKQRAILLLDGMDEISPARASAITKYIKSLLKIYPKLRIVAASSYEDLAGLPELGFCLLGLASWGDEERAAFLSRWSRLWVKLIYPSEKNQQKKINTFYLNSWLKINNTMLKPLEYVLKVWAAYSGDIQGTDGPSAIEAYILRMTSDVPNSRHGLEQYALQQLINVDIEAKAPEPEPTISDQEIEGNPLEPESSLQTIPREHPTQPRRSSIKIPAGIDALVENGFMISYPGSRYGFSHPIIAGYLAGKALTASETPLQILGLPACITKTLAMYYLAYFGDVAPLINNLIQEDDILHTNHLLISRWLQVAPKNRPWRSIILRTLAVIAQKEKDTPSLAAKLISAMAFSGDKGVSVYFRQLLKSDQPTLKLMAALGCGILADKKAIGDLNEILQEVSPASIRSASLALAAIGDKQSLEILAFGMLNGSELVRKSTAEALANNPLEGHPALKDGSTMEDLMVRRAAAFGLIRVNLPWATKIVENMQLEDTEWVVRNAAIQAFDELKRKSEYAPKPLQDLTEAQWLTDYAVRIGTSVAPGKPAEDLVLKALANGTQDEKLNALDYLRAVCAANNVEDIFTAYSNNTGEIKDLAYHALWLMMIAGVKLPVSIKYNIK